MTRTATGGSAAASRPTARAISGVPNAACTAAFEVATLSPTAAYWAGGYIDEVGYWQPSGVVDLAAVVTDVKRALHARGADVTGGVGLTVTDADVAASAAATRPTSTPVEVPVY